MEYDKFIRHASVCGGTSTKTVALQFGITQAGPTHRFVTPVQLYPSLASIRSSCVLRQICPGLELLMPNVAIQE